MERALSDKKDHMLSDLLLNKSHQIYFKKNLPVVEKGAMQFEKPAFNSSSIGRMGSINRKNPIIFANSDL